MPAASTRWRVAIRTVNSVAAWQLGVATLEFRDSSGSAIAPSATTNSCLLATGSTVASATNLLNSSTYPLSALSDGNSATLCYVYASTALSWQYFDFTYGSAILPDSLKINVSSGAGTGSSNSVLVATSLDINIYSSNDGTTWYLQAMHYRPIPASSTDTIIAATNSSSTYPMPNISGYGGSGGIFGIVTEDGVAQANRPVYLFERDTLYKIGYTTSAADGGYSFNGLNENISYLVLSVDPTGTPYKNALVYDRITPINTRSAINPNSPFWARRAKASNLLGGLISYASFLDGATYNYLVSNPLGNGELNFVFNNNNYDGYSFATGLTAADTAGGTLNFLKSNRTASNVGYGMTHVTGAGTPTGLDTSNNQDNYGYLTFELICKTPSNADPGLIVSWSGTTDGNTTATNTANTHFNGSYNYYSRGEAFTIEIRNTGVINVRCNLGSINRSTVRCTGSVTPGAVCHIMVTYVQDSSVKLYINGTLIQTTTLSGSGRLYSNVISAYYNTDTGFGAIDASNSPSASYWDKDVVYQTSNTVLSGPVRRITNILIGGHNSTGNPVIAGTSNNCQSSVYTMVPPGFGGAVALAAHYYKAFTDSEVASFYDSYANYTSHVVSPSQSGYMAQVEADVPTYYFRMNDLSSATRPFNTIGVKDYYGAWEGTPTFNTTGFIQGSNAVNVSNGGFWLGGNNFIPSIFSFECWFRPAAGFFSGYQHFFVASSPNTNSRATAYLRSYNGAIQLCIVDASANTYTYTYSGTSFTAGNDYHLVVTYNPWSGDKKTVLYVNGTAVSTQTAAVYMTNYLGSDSAGSASGASYRLGALYTGLLSIGTNFTNVANPPSFQERLQGVLGEIAIYGYELSATRVAAHYAASGRT